MSARMLYDYLLGYPLPAPLPEDVVAQHHQWNGFTEPCPAQSPNRFLCTQTEGHMGVHIARWGASGDTSDETIAAIWQDDPFLVDLDLL